MLLTKQSGKILLSVNILTLHNAWDSLSQKCWFRGVTHTKESEFSNFMNVYRGKIDSSFENILFYFLKAQMGSNHENIMLEHLVTHFL